MMKNTKGDAAAIAFKFVGIYNSQRYTLQGDGVTDICGEFISFYHKSDYTAIGAARKIGQWVEVPVGTRDGRKLARAKAQLLRLLVMAGHDARP